MNNASLNNFVPPAHEFVYVCNVNLQILESILPGVTNKSEVWVSQDVLMKIMLKHTDLGALSSTKETLLNTLRIVVERAEFAMVDLSKRDPGIRLLSERGEHAIELVLRIRKDGSIVVATMHWLDNKRYQSYHDYKELWPWA
jgi:hypothetical protein